MTPSPVILAPYFCQCTLGGGFPSPRHEIELNDPSSVISLAGIGVCDFGATRKKITSIENSIQRSDCKQQTTENIDKLILNLVKKFCQANEQ